VAILIANGFSAGPIAQLQTHLVREGAIPILVGVRLGSVMSAEGASMEATASLENSPSVLFDGVILPDGDAAVDVLTADAHAMDLLVGQYRHGKTILALGRSAVLLKKAAIAKRLPSGELDPGILAATAVDVAKAAAWFIEALAKHRHPARDRDPPPI
jgi:catalase